MNPRKPSDILPEPPNDLKRHSERLSRRILERIGLDGPISFAEYMEMALYEPGLGYYSAGLHKFGAEGDFVTAPELGDVFGACLARQVAQVFAELGDGDILEVGAGSGKLAAQLLADSDLAGAAPPPQRSRRSAVAARRRSYMILERSADLREVQRQTLERLVPEHLDRVCWLDRPPTEPWQGVLLANEVVDALPIERFLISGDEVRQICVGTDGNRLRLCDRPAPPALEAAVRALGPLPDGYRSEINLQLAPWVESLVAGLERGVALFIDYGYPRREFYLDERSDGTLIANYRHRAHQDVLRYPGLQDLTAFVDFSALASAGKGAGLDQLGYTSQAMFLMGCGLEQVVGKRHGEDVAANMDVNNEVRQLVLPGLMGEKFQVVALGRDWPDSAPLLGFSIRDLRGRL